MKLVIISLFYFLNAPAIAETELVVVVAKNSPVEILNNREVANIFLSRTKQFPNGDRAVPVERKNNLSRPYFYTRISGKTENQLEAYWTTLIFTGKGKPPKSLKSTEKVLMRLNKHPGTITYMLSNEVTENMKIVYVFP